MGIVRASQDPCDCGLMPVRPVFRAMIGTSSGSRLELCDPTLETSKALTGFLDPLINSSDIPLSNLLDPFPVVKLCLKYDCEGLLKQIRNQLRCAVLDQNVTESNILVLGGILGQLDICKEAIHGPTALKAVWKRNAGNQSPERFGASLRGGRVLDPAALAYSDFRAISPAFMWSWMRAYRIAHPPPGVIEPTAAASMSSELQRLADLPGESQRASPVVNAHSPTGAPKPLGGP